MSDPPALRGQIDRLTVAIDALIGRQLDAILHAPRLQRLEGAWRGLAWLVEGIDPATRVKVRLLPVAWAEMARDLDRAAEFDQSFLFRHIYEDEFGMPGGEPFGLLVFEHAVRHRPDPAAPVDDSAVLGQLASIAAAAFAPCVLPAAPALLDADSWNDLAMAPDPASPLRDAAHARFQKLGQREDMRFVGIVAPRVLARPAWPDDPALAAGFRYAEHVPDAASRVWMPAPFAFAATVARAFSVYGWPADLRGVDADREGGGVVTALPAEAWSTERAPLWPRPPLELVFNDGQERALVDGGIMPLGALPYGNDAAFTSLRSLQVPQRFTPGAGSEAAGANARLSAQLNSMLCVSRFAHYVKVIGRDMAGSFKTADDIERRLQAWLNGYVNASATAGPETRARFPLLAGKVTVREQPGRPGAFGCTIFLQPHFQLDDVAATFRLTTDIRAPGRAA